MKLFICMVMALFLTTSGNAQSIKGHKTIQNDTVYIDLVNTFIAPIELNLKTLDSTKSYTRVKPYGILQKGDTLKNAIVIPVYKLKDTANIDIKKYMTVDAKFGEPNENYDKDYLYELPFQKGKPYKVIQTFGGKFSHNQPHSKYAIDFGLQIGDTITAARKGQVYFIKEDSQEHCRTRKCVDKANKIYVLHDDGTMAHYVHLDFEGALVDVGDTVEANQPIGISGMTGFTTLPHLHFVLYKARSISIPYRFNGMKGKKLKQGRYYKRTD